MLTFLFFIACVGIFIFLFLKLKHKFFNPFISASKLRLSIWNWTKKVILIGLSILLLIGSFERWYYIHDEIRYASKSLALDLSYADQIEMEAYLMNEQDLISLFEGNPPIPNMTEASYLKAKQEPYGDNPMSYFVLRVKNKGDHTIYGVVEDRENGYFVRDINVPPLPPHMTEFKEIVLWSSSSMPGTYPQKGIKWKQIFTIKGEKT